MKFQFDGETYGDHFGRNPTVIVEGGSARYHKIEEQAINDDDEEKSFGNEFWSFFSDDADQSAATSFENMKKQLSDLEKKTLVRGKTIVYDHTDGCSKQCRCATSMQLLTMLSMQFEVVIDRMVNAARHGKCMIDGMNAVSKHHCADCMTRIVNPNDDLDNNLKQRFESWLHKDGKEHSLAEQCVRLLSEPNRKNGVMCAGNKHKKGRRTGCTRNDIIAL